MTIEIKTKNAPINRQFFLASLFGAATWALWPHVGDTWPKQFFFGASAIGTLIGFSGGLKLLIQDYHLRRKLRLSEQISDDHGSSHESNWEDVVKQRMDDANSGNLLGLHDGTLPVFSPTNAPFSLIEMPPGVGKTTCYVVGSILHQAKLGKSICVADPKQELGPMLIPALQELGIECWAINPTGANVGTVGAVELNPYQALLDAVSADDDTKLDAVKYTHDFANLHLPDRPDEKNPYFAQGSRRAIAIEILGNAVIDPANCNPTGTFLGLNDPRQFLKRLNFIRNDLDTGHDDDPVVAHLKSEAANLLHRAAKNEENFSSFLEGATQRLISFSPGGRLGGYGRTAIQNIAELRERQIALFIMTPLSHIREFSPFISLLNENLIAACKRHPTGHPVHIVAEEALNYRFNDLASNLEVMRGLGVGMDIYIQSFAGLERQYGKETAAAIESYSDVRVYAGLNSYARAKHVSDMLSETTLRKQDYSYQAELKEIGVSSKELGRRLRKPDEILAQERGKAWVFIRGMRPMELTMAHYGQVTPWRDWVRTNPIEGSALRDTPLFHIEYENGDEQ